MSADRRGAAGLDRGQEQSALRAGRLGRPDDTDTAMQGQDHRRTRQGGWGGPGERGRQGGRGRTAPFP